jgi:very-short-patch-repair endonuclease
MVRLHPDVYTPDPFDRSMLKRIRAALAWAGDDAVVCGTSAAYLHGVAWLHDEESVHLTRLESGRRRHGIVGHRYELKPSDIVTVAGMKCTSPIRTAFDLGRQRPDWRALGYLDAICGATGFDKHEFWRYVVEHPKYRGIRQLRGMVPFIDGLAESPRESQLRLVLIKAGFTNIDMQIKVYNGSGVVIFRLDLGWKRWKVALEYDGDDFHSTEEQIESDESREIWLRNRGWRIIRVNAALLADPGELISRVREELWLAGARDLP